VSSPNYRSAAFSARFGSSSGILLQPNNTRRYASSHRKLPTPWQPGPYSIQRNALPNLSLNPDPACNVFRSLSTSCFLGFGLRFAAGGAG